MTAYRYLHYDVFTARRFEGNPLAVLPDARGLSDAQMQAVAREMAFSETTFVLPPGDAATEHRLRIFTPARELPMAGHPTVGTTFALAREGVLTAGAEQVVYGLGVGPTPVDLEWDGDALRFAWMTQPLPEFGPVHDDPAVREAVASALGVAAGDLSDESPLQVVSSGVPFLYVPLRTREAVDRVSVDLAALRRLDEAHGFEHYYVFTTDGGGVWAPEATTYSRMFAPALGVMEDPATGGASGPLGAYLVHHGLVAPGQATEIVNLQGVAMGRPSWIRIEVRATAGRQVGRVRIGGEAVLVAEGTIEV